MKQGTSWKKMATYIAAITMCLAMIQVANAQVVKVKIPDGAFPTDEVYVTTTTGKRECINFQHNGFDNEFKAYTLSYE